MVLRICPPVKYNHYITIITKVYSAPNNLKISTLQLLNIFFNYAILSKTYKKG